MNVLVIAAHPDDETLGCGGVLLKHNAAGDNLYWLVATQAYQPQWSAETIELKAEEVSEVERAYGIKSCFKLGFPAGQLDTQPMDELIRSIYQVISQVSPQIVYLVNGGDVHTDHYAVFTASMSVLKPFHMANLGVKKVICYETLSSTEAGPNQAGRGFSPNIFSDITPYMERKIEILDIYRTEIQSDPMPRAPSALRALARFRGATISVEYAEAFVLIRELA